VLLHYICCTKTERASPTDKLIRYHIHSFGMRAVQYLNHVHTGRGNKKSLQPIRSKAINAWFPALSTVACFSELCFVYCILCVSSCGCFDFTTFVRKSLTTTKRLSVRESGTVCDLSNLFIPFQCPFCRDHVKSLANSEMANFQHLDRGGRRGGVSDSQVWHHWHR